MNDIWLAVGVLLLSIGGGGFAVVRFFLPQEGDRASDLVSQRRGWDPGYVLDRICWWRWGLELAFALLFIAGILTTIIGVYWSAIEK
jgi:hypothetical protein